MIATAIPAAMGDHTRCGRARVVPQETQNKLIHLRVSGDAGYFASRPLIKTAPDTWTLATYSVVNDFQC